MSLESYCLNIPCKSHIAKYYSTIYGSPFDLTRKNDFADLLITKLDSEPARKLKSDVLTMALKGLDSGLKFKLPINLFYRIDNNITKHKIWNVNRSLVNAFNNDFLLTCTIASVFGVEKRTTIEKFAQHYGIILEEDITYEALKKSEYRLRQNAVFKNKFLVLLSSPYQFNLRA